MRLRVSVALAALSSLAILGSGKDAEGAHWTVPRDFGSIQAAIDAPAVRDGDVIHVRPGRRRGATVTKAVEIRGDRTIIVNGPRPWADRPEWKAGFLFPGGGSGSGATVSGLSFEGVEFPVYSRGADDVSVLRCRMNNPIQGVSNWASGQWGNAWNVVGNLIVDLRSDCAGGIGVFVGDFLGGTVHDGLVAHNVIRGRLRPAEDDCGGYDGSAVVVYADFRWGNVGAALIEGIRIVKNRVALSSTAPEVVDVVAVELTDTRDDGSLAAVLKDNDIAYNDLRGTLRPIVLTPAELALVNRIEQNQLAIELDGNRGALAGGSLEHPRSYRPARPVH